MFGPRPPGFWSRLGPAGAGEDYRHLRVGHRYRVMRAFVDFDGDEHAVGETWTFSGWSYLPHDSGLSLFVRMDGEADGEWHIRMMCTPDEQGPVVDMLEMMIQEVE